MNETKLAELLQSRAYNPANAPESEQIVFRIQFQNIGSLGNINLLTGLPKAGKSKYISGMMAAAISRQSVFSLNIRLPDDKHGVAHWDTEQNLYDYYSMMKLVKKLAGLPEFPANFRSFHCRRDNARTIMSMIQYYLKRYPDTGILFLDGLLDMIDRFNDEGQSKQLVNFLKHITDVHNILVIGVLHRSVSAAKSIGHLGSSADRSAQSVLVVEKNKEARQYILRAEYLRSADDIEPIAIFYNKELETWEQTDYIPLEEPTRGGSRKPRPGEITTEEHQDNVRRVFYTKDPQPYQLFCRNIAEIYALGIVKAKDTAAYLLREGFVFKNDNGEYTRQRQSNMFAASVKK